MKLVFIFVVLGFGYIQTNGEGVSKCYFCNSFTSNVTCNDPEIQNCPAEQNNICIGVKIPNSDETYLYARQCDAFSSEIVEACVQINQSYADGYCYICDEDLCKFR